uniref:V-type proton ATPase subunit G n=1 Tax=Astyanax mexicanus TaxID=7994 RepID=A0A3B1IY40_ASTMX
MNIYHTGSCPSRGFYSGYSNVTHSQLIRAAKLSVDLRCGKQRLFVHLLYRADLSGPWRASLRASSSCCRRRNAPPRRWLTLGNALGSHGNSAVEVDKETLDKMKRIETSYHQNREAVLNNLLKMVCDIKPEIHVNYRVAG